MTVHLKNRVLELMDQGKTFRASALLSNWAVDILLDLLGEETTDEAEAWFEAQEEYEIRIQPQVKQELD